mgnify:CR=1 FL=1
MPPQIHRTAAQLTGTCHRPSECVVKVEMLGRPPLQTAQFRVPAAPDRISSDRVV